MDEPAAAPASPGPERPRRSPTGHIAAVVSLIVLAVAVAASVTAWWALRTEPGSAWLLSRVPGVTVEAPTGPLLGDFSARRLTVNLAGGTSVALQGLAWRGLHIGRASAARWLRIELDALSVTRIDVTSGPRPATTPPQAAPTDLRLPIELDLHALRIGELHASALGAAPLRDLAAHVHLGAEAGARHRIDDLGFAWERLQVRGGARIATRAPLALQASIGLAQATAAALPAWRAAVALTGPLAGPLLQATLRAEPAPPRPAQSLDARGTLHPFAAWPLGELQANARGLDLSAFSSAAPQTLLDFAARARTTAADQPAQVSIDLSNELAGRWNDGRLPLRRLTLELAARPDRPRQLDVRSFGAELGTAQAVAGRLAGAGHWAPDGWNLDATLDALQPALLDIRAPAMQLSGPVTLAGAATTDIGAALTGTLVDRGVRRLVQFKVDANVAPQRIELRALRAAAGGAQASLSGLFTQAAADAPWVAKAQATLVDFDPAVWWPGGTDSALRRAVTKLNAQGRVDLSVPLAMASRPALQVLAALRGEVSVTLGQSVLAGVPATGAASWRNPGSGPATVLLRLDAAGNSIRADGRLNVAGNGTSDEWNLVLDAAALDKLAPVYKLWQPAGAESGLGGTLSARAHVSGRWPALSTQGDLDAGALRMGTISIQKAQAHWSLGTAANAPVEAHATLSQASLQQGAAPGPSLQTLQFDLQGSGRDHTLALRADTKALPPAWTDNMQPSGGTGGGTGTTAVLQAQGGLFDVAGAVDAGWRGTLKQIDLRRSGVATAPLLHAEKIDVQARWGGTGAEATVQPGRVELLGGAIRWSRMAWRAAKLGSDAQIEADAELEPLHAAPVLARLQPGFGWGGDLTLAGHVKLHSAPTFSADVVLERSGGDLSVTDELGTRALGLTDLRLGLSADNGTWNFTQGLAGKTLGVLAGAVVVRSSPRSTWPTPDAPLQGVLELRVDDLGAWGSWVPPGWRLGGGLHTSASFGGRFGAPEYTGLVQATQLSVRNFLQGVNVTDGDVAVRLKGSTAQIERFTAKAGNGTLRLEGDAELGDSPRAALRVVADKFQLLGRVDRRIVASGDGQLRLDAKTLGFDGKFRVDEGLIDFTRSDAPTLSDDVVVRRPQDVPAPAAAAAAAAVPETSALPTATPSRAVALDLAVDLGEQLQIRGRGLDAKLRGDLRITSPSGRLAINGTVRAEDGTYAAYGQKLVIDRGLVTFSGAIDNPRLDIEATRPNLDIRVGVIISGTPADPRVRLFSEPELSDIDKLSWLVLGHAGDSNGRSDAALLQRAALALFAGEGGGPTDQITKSLGLDDISLRQQTDGDVTQTVLAVGKQLSKRWYVGYARGLNATTGSFELIYRIAQRFTLRAQSGGDNSVDLIWTWRWK